MNKVAQRLVLALSAALWPALALAQNCIIPVGQLVNGGPGPDGIPALTVPRVVSAAEGDGFLDPEGLVLGVVVNGESRAYPHNVLWWHEIVNDVLGGRPILVTYCPLTGSGLVFDPAIADQPLQFGTSGLLFDNNLVMFDRSTQSLWSQMRVEAICGSFSRTVPRLLPVVQSTWAAWKALHPETTVVSFETGFRRNYNQYPYGSYDQLTNGQILFPHSFIDPRRPLKELVLGIREGEVSRAYPYTALGERTVINDSVSGREVVIVFDRTSQMALPFERQVDRRTLTFEPVEATGFPFTFRDRETGSTWDLRGRAMSGPLAGAELTPVATYSAMWFAWASFNRGTEIYTP